MLKIFLSLREKMLRLYFLLSEAKYKAKHGKWLKILTPKQILKRLSIALAQVKADNISEHLLNLLIYSLYRAKEITKKV